MSTQSTELALGLALHRAANAEFLREPSELELQVVSLFDEYRNRLLRYVVSLGVSPVDGEEVNTCSSDDPKRIFAAGFFASRTTSH
jgi:hypothetical protein